MKFQVINTLILLFITSCRIFNISEKKHKSHFIGKWECIASHQFAYLDLYKNQHFKLKINTDFSTSHSTGIWELRNDTIILTLKKYNEDDLYSNKMKDSVLINYMKLYLSGSGMNAITFNRDETLKYWTRPK